MTRATAESRDANVPSPVVVIVGQTASGKSDLAVEIARAHKGEVVSADSRQVYRGMDIGTGKVTKREMRGIPHHLLDVAAPTGQYSVSRYKREALRAIRGIVRRGRIPIICGGTGFYIQAIVDGVILPEVPPRPSLRRDLQAYPTPALFDKLLALDPERAGSIDPFNRVRLVRAIEIAETLGSVPKLAHDPPKDLRFLQVGIRVPDALLRERIHRRLLARMRSGMVAEAKRLHDEMRVPWVRMESLGLEYRYLSRYVRGVLTKEQMLRELETAILQYARRQRTWFRRDPRVVWIDIGDTRKALHLVRDFLS